jgi:hypothetical protein
MNLGCTALVNKDVTVDGTKGSKADFRHICRRIQLLSLIKAWPLFHALAGPSNSCMKTQLTLNKLISSGAPAGTS